MPKFRNSVYFFHCILFRLILLYLFLFLVTFLLHHFLGGYQPFGVFLYSPHVGAVHRPAALEVSHVLTISGPDFKCRRLLIFHKLV